MRNQFRGVAAANAAAGPAEVPLQRGPAAHVWRSFDVGSHFFLTLALLVKFFHVAAHVAVHGAAVHGADIAQVAQRVASRFPESSRRTGSVLTGRACQTIIGT